MAKYRKKPVEVEAIQLGWDTWNQVCDFVEGEAFGAGVYLDDETKEVLPEGSTSNTMGLRINTLEGVMLATEGDYIIKGIKGEFYPCKPDIFEQTYELVEDEPTEERWFAAIDNARFMLEEYKKIPAGAFGAVGIANDIARYENGERTKELLEALEEYFN